MNNQEQLLYLRGVASEYLNYHGDRVVVPHWLRLKLLEEMGHDVSDERALERAIHQLDALPWKSWLSPFIVLSLGVAEHIDIRVHPDEQSEPFAWCVITEQGREISGQFIPQKLEEVGDYYLEGIRYSARRHPLPHLPMGYHRIRLSTQAKEINATLAVTPPRALEAEEEKIWGVSCQLYTLRSERNWGVGDFTDLAQLIEYSAAAGMDVVGLNPLHAPNLAAEDFASPYSPSDRRFLNPLYIDPVCVEDFQENKSLTDRCCSSDFQQKLEALRSAPMVDYAAVVALKYPVFDGMYEHFCRHHLASDSERAKAYIRFAERGGKSLQAYSRHESLNSGLRSERAGDPHFHQYLQWLADDQLQRCQSLALDCGMKVGIMRDLAVGAVKNGAEVETNRALFCRNATIGAPPDPLGPRGQNWNLPALDPLELRRDEYRHFIDLLSSNMAHCGALRIDHVMGLLRLWWCLPNVAEGAYVYYPLEDLLGILRLESHRNRCMVIGEDLGVVPDELRAKLSAAGVYSNKIFYFERWQDQQFKLPQDHTQDALLMVTNHDVPTLAGWWNGSDLQIRSECGVLGSEEELAELLRGRREDKMQVLAWLRHLKLIPRRWADMVEPPEDRPLDFDLCAAILHACASSRSTLLLFQLDDLQLLEQPVNIPGTSREYPNWRRKQRQSIQTLFGDPLVQALLNSMSEKRRL